ncbi:carcinoembryonic antigen-related cell adhesion molecule 1-like [Bufo bufo]|uniref:carcinoembryonic antigen-related cell adhesion molecule 1-like n=1 Tax=Bufo bufo TaxID=8384 RepID=UPI001ABE2566|nr:carcinoembryonic antigen-related cell adhesion molecule 1-like [Bufo bufo]
MDSYSKFLIKFYQIITGEKEEEWKRRSCSQTLLKKTKEFLYAYVLDLIGLKLPKVFYYLQVNSAASVVNGVLGGSAFFNVSVESLTTLEITWRFGDNLIVQVAYNSSPECFHQIIKKYEIYGNGSLKLYDITEEYEGDYTLTVNRTGEALEVQDYHLRVYPSLIAPVLRPDHQEFINGTNGTLHCDDRNQTVTTYTFYHDEEKICSKPHVTCRGSSLDFTPISEIYNGSYTCRIENPVSSSTSDPINVIVSWYPEGGILCTTNTINQDVRLGCSWPGGNPAAKVTMIYDNRTETGQDRVSRNVSSSNITLGSNLICNGHQLGRQSTCALLFEPPQSPDHEVSSTIKVAEGETVSLTLTLSSGARLRAFSSSLQILRAHFSWFYDSMPIQSNEKFQVTSTNESSRLRIFKVSELNSGKYTCRAENVIGTKEFIFTLTVTSQGLNIDKISGIVLGILAGLLIAGVGVMVHFILKRKQMMPKALIHKNADSSLSNIYENTGPRAPQIQHPDESVYCNVLPGRRT